MADVLRVRLLGGFEARAGERSVPAGAWRLRKARTLVKLLALEPAHALHRDTVIDALWPDLPPEAGRNNLNQAVHAARRALATVDLDGTAAVAVQGELLVLAPATGVVTDVEELQTAVRAARAAGRRDEVARLLRDCPGELLPEDAYEPWVQQPAEAFREWRAQAGMDVAQALLDDGRPDDAVVLLAPVVKAHPLHEPAVRVLMRALAACGRRTEALLVYERLRDLLRDQLAAEPELQTREVFRALLAGDDGQAQEPVTVPTQRASGNLPVAVTALVGRSRELAETRSILGRTRLLTLTGMGGVGKTTLAVELARASAPDFSGGAHLVELGTLTDSDQVAPHIARALRIELPPDASPVEAMVAQLRQRHLLVVLDNCEHLLDACARVVTSLLRGCPGVRVLATSREALRIEGEVAWRTPSLELPDPVHVPLLPELASVASVELFVQRASAALPAFALTEHNAVAVAEICYRLDGIPLALELAAACVTVLSPQQIASRLGDSLNLLRRGDRATITRQQTLEATLRWSHDLLDDSERVLFRRLAVFAGSFTLDAVEDVCAAGLGPAGVLAALARLVDTSLVSAEARGDVTRYRLLETVRQYAMEQLRAADLAETQRRHCDWYLRFARDQDRERSPLAGVSPALDAEQDNLRLALTWALRQQPQSALELAVALWRFWLARGLFAEGRQWLEAALDAAPQPTPLRARALLALAVLDVRRGDGRRLAELGAEAVRIHRAQGGRDGLARALLDDAVLAFMRGTWDECWQRACESLTSAEDGRMPHLALAARHVQATVLLARGRFADARSAFLGIAAALPTLPEARRPFFAPLLLGFAVDTSRGSARVYFEETVLLGRLVGADQAAAYVQCDLSDLARLTGDLDEALASVREAAARFAALGDVDGEGLAYNRLGCLHRVRGEFADGRQALARSLRLRRSLGDRRAIGLTQANIGLLVATEGGLAEGCGLIEDALAVFAENQDGPARIGLALTLANIHADAGDFERADQLLDATLAASHLIPGNARATAWAHVVRSDVLDRLGRHDQAMDEARTARALFAAVGAVDGPAYLRRRSRMQSRR